MRFFHLLTESDPSRVPLGFKKHFSLLGVAVLLALQLCEVHGRHRSLKRAFLHGEGYDMTQTLLESRRESGFRGLLGNVVQSFLPRQKLFPEREITTKTDAQGELRKFDIAQYSQTRISKPDCVEWMIRKKQNRPKQNDGLLSRVPPSDDINSLQTAAAVLSSSEASSKDELMKEFWAFYYLSKRAAEHPSVEHFHEEFETTESPTTSTKHSVIALCLRGYQRIFNSNHESVEFLAEAAFDETKAHLPNHELDTIEKFHFDPVEYYTMSQRTGR